MQTRHIVHTFEGHQQDIYSIAYSADGSLLASGSGDCLVKLWDPLHGKFIKDLTVEDPDAQKDAGVTSVAFSPDGTLLVAGALDKAIRLWNVLTGSLLATLPDAHGDSVYSVGFSPDGALLISGGLDRMVNLWKFDNDTLLKEESLAGHKDFVLATAFLGNSGYAVSGSKDRQLLIWKVPQHNKGDKEENPADDAAAEKSSLTCWFQAHKNSIIAMAIPASPFAKVFATGSGDKKAKIWKYRCGSSTSADKRTTDEDASPPSDKKMKLENDDDDEDPDS